MFIHVEPAAQTQTAACRTEAREQSRVKRSLTCGEGDAQAGGEARYSQDVIKTPSSHQQGGDPLDNHTETVLKCW